MSHLYMKLYSPQEQQYYTAVDNNNKKEGKKQRLTILQYKYSTVSQPCPYCRSHEADKALL